ncbi:MAG TPA: helix-turn-helix domain-containing protein [Candidatus Binataceae bacterium]|nr:helix-turn-helix domain-containing protein [Candidatus Binataceae bacterium]
MSSHKPSDLARKLRVLADQIEYIGHDSIVTAIGSEFNLEDMLGALQGALARHFHVLSPEAIARTVAAALRVPVSEMRSPGRRQHVTFARQVAMYLMREVSALTFPQIGGYFGRDHSTVMHAHHLIACRLAGDCAFAATIDGLRRALGAHPEQQKLTLFGPSWPKAVETVQAL